MKHGKVCKNCKKAKPLSEFIKFVLKSENLILHRDQCKECEDKFKKSRGQNG